VAASLAPASSSAQAPGAAMVEITPEKTDPDPPKKP
jgi:hypothetical protein